MSKQRYWITLLGVTAVSTGLTIVGSQILGTPTGPFFSE
jgi:hypothetical protein